jgi:hypothetical protein
MRGYTEVTVKWIRIADGAEQEAARNGATLPAARHKKIHEK